jgi:hypothetical protein
MDLAVDIFRPKVVKIKPVVRVPKAVHFQTGHIFTNPVAQLSLTLFSRQDDLICKGFDEHLIM